MLTVDRDFLSRGLERRLRTSVPRLYRLLAPTNTRKSLSQLVSLLQALDCIVEVVVKPRVTPNSDRPPLSLKSRRRSVRRDLPESFGLPTIGELPLVIPFLPNLE